MSWPKEDLTFHEALLKLVREATFSLKGKEVVAFATIYVWLENMPNNYVKKPKKKVSKK